VRKDKYKQSLKDRDNCGRRRKQRWSLCSGARPLDPYLYSWKFRRRQIQRVWDNNAI